jgi:SAM-dependent methyltransferase
MTAHDRRSTAAPDGDNTQPSRAWQELTTGYELARAREDSLDRLVEWPAQRALLGDVTGCSILDLGCGNGGKLAELVREGAVASAGVDIAGNFISDPPSGAELIRADLSHPESLPQLRGRTFDRILFLQSFGYAEDPVHTLRVAGAMLNRDGFILLSRTQPLRHALERTERNGTTLGEEYFSGADHTYRTSWNEHIALTVRPFTMSGLLNTFSAAGLWIETTVEPRITEEAARRYPHKQEWMNKYLGILIFKLRPLAPGSSDPQQ